MQRMAMAPPSEKGEKSGPTIGTLSEYQLHRELKAYFMADPLFHEQPVGPYVADIRCGNEIVEIQSKDLYKMKAKLDYYLSEGFSVTVVYPVVLEKRLIWLDPDTGEVVSSRRCPKKGRVLDLFGELARLPAYLTRENLSFVAVTTRVVEYRSLNGQGKNRKKGARHLQRIPTELLHQYRFSSPKDYLSVLPGLENLPQPFTVGEFSAQFACPIPLARAVVRVLRQLGEITYCGKRGRMYEYRCVPFAEVTPQSGN